MCAFLAHIKTPKKERKQMRIQFANTEAIDVIKQLFMFIEWEYKTPLRGDRV